MRKYLDIFFAIFSIKSPYASLNTDNPLLYIDVRQIQPTTPAILTRRTLLRVGFVLVLTVFFANWLSPPGEFWSGYAIFLGIFTYCLWLLGFIVDLIMMTFGAYSIRRFFFSDIYELVKVSALPPLRLIESRFKVAQLRSWATLIGMFWLRVGFLILWIPYLVYAVNEYILNPFHLPVIRAGLLGGLLTILPVTVYYFLYELLWRYETLIAFSMRQMVKHATLSTAITQVVIRLILFVYSQTMAFVLIHGLFSAVPLGVLTLGVNPDTKRPDDVVLTFLAAFLYGFSMLGSVLVLRRYQLTGSIAELKGAAQILEDAPLPDQPQDQAESVGESL